MGEYVGKANPRVEVAAIVFRQGTCLADCKSAEDYGTVSGGKLSVRIIRFFKELFNIRYRKVK